MGLSRNPSTRDLNRQGTCRLFPCNTKRLAMHEVFQKNQGISRPSPWHHNATTNAPRAASTTTHFRDTTNAPRAISATTHFRDTTNAPRAISATTHFRNTVIPPASGKHPSVKSQDQQDDIHASLCRCTCNMQREASPSIGARLRPLSKEVSPGHILGTEAP